MRVHIYNSDFRFINDRYLDEVIENEVPNASEEQLDRIYEEAKRELTTVGRYWLSARYYIVPADRKVNA